MITMGESYLKIYLDGITPMQPKKREIMQSSCIRNTVLSLTLKVRKMRKGIHNFGIRWSGVIIFTPSHFTIVLSGLVPEIVWIGRKDTNSYFCCE
jgi:hypothetical protein